MKLDIDISKKFFTVAKEPEPKVDAGGVQKLERATESPMWTTQLFVRDESGGDIISVITAGTKPDVEPGEEVNVIDLYAYEWENKGRHGLNYRATAISFVEETSNSVVAIDRAERAESTP